MFTFGKKPISGGNGDQSWKKSTLNTAVVTATRARAYKYHQIELAPSENCCVDEYTTSGPLESWGGGSRWTKK